MQAKDIADGLEARRAWAELRQNVRRHNRDAWDSEYQALMGQYVTPTASPSLAVRVNVPGGVVTLTMPVANPVHPRIDTVCTDGTSVRVVCGIPSARPVPPAVPHGFGPIAHVSIPANATSVPAANIQGVNP